MAVPSVTKAQGQVSVIQIQWSPEAGAKGTFDQADHSMFFNFIFLYMCSYNDLSCTTMSYIIIGHSALIVLYR